MQRFFYFSDMVVYTDKQPSFYKNNNFVQQPPFYEVINSEKQPPFYGNIDFVKQPPLYEIINSDK